jgi:hypothetical protein
MVLVIILLGLFNLENLKKELRKSAVYASLSAEKMTKI